MFGVFRPERPGPILWCKKPHKQNDLRVELTVSQRLVTPEQAGEGTVEPKPRVASRQAADPSASAAFGP